MTQHDGVDEVRARVRSSFKGGEARRGIVATALGVALGLVIVIFSRKEQK